MGPAVSPSFKPIRREHTRCRCLHPSVQAFLSSVKPKLFTCNSYQGPVSSDCQTGQDKMTGEAEGCGGLPSACSEAHSSPGLFMHSFCGLLKSSGGQLTPRATSPSGDGTAGALSRPTGIGWLWA